MNTHTPTHTRTFGLPAATLLNVEDDGGGEGEGEGEGEGGVIGSASCVYII